MATVREIIGQVVRGRKRHGNSSLVQQALRELSEVGQGSPRPTGSTDQVFVGGLVHIVVHLGRVLGADFKEPSIAKRVFVDFARIVF